MPGCFVADGAGRKFLQEVYGPDDVALNPYMRQPASVRVVSRIIEMRSCHGAAMSSGSIISFSRSPVSSYLRHHPSVHAHLSDQSSDLLVLVFGRNQGAGPLPGFMFDRCLESLTRKLRSWGNHVRRRTGLKRWSTWWVVRLTVGSAKKKCQAWEGRQEPENKAAKLGVTESPMRSRLSPSPCRLGGRLNNYTMQNSFCVGLSKMQ